MARPTGSKNKQPPNIRALAAIYTPLCLKTLANIVTRSKNEGNKISAATELMNRAHGKAPQAIIGDPDAPLSLKITWEE